MTTFTCLVNVLKNDFERANKQYLDNPSATNFNLMNDHAIADQQAFWLGRTPQLNDEKRERIAADIILDLPWEKWGKAVIKQAAKYSA
jgi:hypothetical protein